MFPNKARTLPAALVLVMLVCSLVILARMTRADPPERAARARWEYKALTRIDVEKLAPRPTEPNTISEGMNSGNLGQGLDVLGGEGWELVAIEPFHHDSYRDPGTGSRVNLNYFPTYVFKRAK